MRARILPALPAAKASGLMIANVRSMVILHVSWLAVESHALLALPAGIVKG
jgi:hypothetical protein